MSQGLLYSHVIIIQQFPLKCVLEKILLGNVILQMSEGTFLQQTWSLWSLLSPNEMPQLH